MVSDTEICQSKDIGYLILEHVFKNVPSLYFFYTSWVNYNEIYELSFERAYKFSCLFKTKLVTVRFLVFICFLNVVFECCFYYNWKYVPVHALTAHNKLNFKNIHILGNHEIERCIIGTNNHVKIKAEIIFYDIIYILIHLVSFVQVVAWEHSYKLMRYSYKKGLSEEWYS